MPDLSDTVAKCRMGTAKKFYTSIASLSHISKVAGHETVYGEVDVTKSRKEKHNPDGTSGTVKKYCGNTRFLL